MVAAGHAAPRDDATQARLGSGGPALRTQAGPRLCRPFRPHQREEGFGRPHCGVLWSVQPIQGVNLAWAAPRGAGVLARPEVGGHKQGHVVEATAVDTNPPHNPDAERLFAQTWVRMRRLAGLITDFRKVAEVGYPYAAAAIAAEHKKFSREFAEDAYLRGILLVDLERFIGEGYADKIAVMMTESTLKNASTSVDAASLIIAHAIADATIFDCCRISALESPNSWERRLEDRKVALSEITGPREEVRDRLLSRFLADLERESLLKKCTLLYEICRPGPGWTAIEGYRYDADRLKGIDAERHAVLHGLQLKEPVVDCAGKVQFLEKTAMHFWAMLNQAYGLKMDPAYMVQLVADQAGAAPGREVSPAGPIAMG